MAPERKLQREFRHSADEGKRERLVKFHIGLRLLGKEREKRFLHYMLTVQGKDQEVTNGDQDHFQ